MSVKQGLCCFTNVLFTFTIFHAPSKFAFRKSRTLPIEPGCLFYYYFNNYCTSDFTSAPYTALLCTIFTVYFYYSTTTPAVCISKTELRPLSQELLFYFSSILPISRLYYCTICRFTIYYFTVLLSTITILPCPQPFASRKPNCTV